MKRSDLKSKIRKNRLAHRCLAVLMVLSTVAALALPGYDTLPTVSAANEEDTAVPLAAPEDDNNLLAWFKFDDSDDRLKDWSGNKVVATLVDVDNIIGTDNDSGNHYLDLQNSNAYLSLQSNILKDLTEMTVEMQVLTTDTNTNYWAFFAAPNGDAPELGKEQYLGILLNDHVTVERYDNEGERPENPSTGWTANEWHKIRVVFAKESTTLYIVDNDGSVIQEVTQKSDKALTDCLGDNGILWLGHASWGAGEGFSGCIDNISIWSSAEPTKENLIAKFDFEDEENRLKDSSGKGVVATNVGGVVEAHDFFPEEGKNPYLDLRNKNAYLSLKNANGSGVLACMAEVTVEMRVKTEQNIDDIAQWAFYAAPNDSPPWTGGNEHYLSVHLTNNTAVARRYDGARPNGTPNSAGLKYNEWKTGEWYTVKVIYEAGQTTLSVEKDGESEVVFSAIATDLSANVWDCAGENNDSVLWFGYSGWGEYFNGCIDDIKIWGTPYYITEDVEKKHIITKDVVDPANTVVNMFDYWVFGDQTGRDYGWGIEKEVDDLVDYGINKDHLFLFDGSASLSGGDSDELGIWNNYGGTGFDTAESKWGVVKNKLTGDGYPQLALDALTWAAPSNPTLNKLWTNEKRTESLAYLFDPDKDENNSDIEGKASYPNVTGLFQIDDDGYYYFRSQEVFAELNIGQEYDTDWPKTSLDDNNHITLYDTPWLEEYARGQFFPFNDWTDLFYEVNGNPVQRGDQGYQAQANNQPMNHWFGMTIETKFMQPTNGMLNPDTPMTFEFSGDDDVWIFIDDVLVADVGGIHMRIRVTIDYATGEIKYERNLKDDGKSGNPFKDGRDKTYLYDVFEAALSEEEFNNLQWNENSKTFADGTMHTLKFFYLERGNAASNCNIRFNLQEPIAERIRKVDQNGDPLEGAEFVLYKATVNDGININDGEWWHTASDFKIDGGPITTTTIKSDEDGYASLTANGAPLDLTQNTYYILEETVTPAGYRKNPPIVLQYHEASNTHTVVNKYETGAYASFLAEWIGPEEVYFAEYEDNEGTFLKDDDNKANETNETELAKGLAIVVPVVKSRDTSDGNPIWLPMYGSNTYGWNTVIPGSNSEEDLIKALAEAAIMQISDSITQDWYLSWDGTRLKGYMENLPGDATRYVFNGGSDGDLVTLFLPGKALEELGLSDNTYEDDDKRYMALKNVLEGMNAETLVALAEDLSGLKILYTNENFIKNNRTVIYVPNEQRELRVRKVDEEDNPKEGAVFALFDTAEHAADSNSENLIGVLACGTTGTNGELIFRANGLTNSEADYGYAEMKWDSGTAVYWLKEIIAPAGYALNESLIRVEVDDDGIYANATGFSSEGELLTGDAAPNDGIIVEASLGRLAQTMVKYAEGIVDETLEHITFTKQTADSKADGAVGTWGDASGDAAENKKLTYEANGYGSVNFTADAGYIRVMPRQTQGITNPTAKRDILTVGGDGNGDPINLDGLFSLINTVVVTDMPIGNLTVTKKVEDSEGEEIDNGAEFDFTVTLSGEGAEDINGTYGDMLFEKGVATFTLKHGGSKTAEGLPAGITYTVEESDYEGYTVNSTGETGEIKKNETVTAAFTNHIPPTGNLTVKKTVEAPEGEEEIFAKAEFAFTVKLSDKTFNHTYSFKGDKIINFVDGVAEFILRHDESVTFTGLPAGVTYTVTEAEAEGYKEASTGKTGTILKNNTVTAAFINTAVGSLTVTKTVTGNAGDETKAFHFTVTLSDKTINGKYGDMTFTNGIADFDLRHGDSMTAENLPAGITYEVDETGNEGYEVTATGDKDTIQIGEETTAEFINDRTLVGSLIVTKTVSGNAGDMTKAFHFTVTLSDKTINGEYGDMTFENGVAEFDLKHDESMMAKNLPYGITYEVVETGNEGYEVTATGYEGTIEEDTTAIAAFVNDRTLVGNLTVNKTVTGNAGDKTKAFTFTVTLKDKTINGEYGEMTFKNGVATFTLKDGESKTATGLPAGITYTVTESDNDGYKVTSIGATGTIPENGTATAAVTNTKATGNLIVTKNVTGSGGDLTQEFSFIVRLGDTSISGAYGDMNFVNGIAIFTLASGENKTAMGLPAGITYTVEESDNDGYMVTMTGEQGTITDGATATAAFTNAREMGNLIVSKTVTGSGGDLTQEFTFKVTLSDDTITGTYGNMRFVGGRAIFMLKSGESKMAEGLPAGITYEVEESGNDGYKMTATGEKGRIEDGQTATAAFNNAAVGGLTVRKIVAGDAVQTQDEAFKFTVTLSDTSINGYYPDENGEDGMNFTNGEATFMLKSGESKTATGLPAEITYTVVEESYDDNDNVRYVVTATGNTGTIKKGATVYAEFINTKDTEGFGDLIVEKEVVGDGADKNKDFYFTVTLIDVTPAITGLYGEMEFDNNVAEFTLKHGQFMKAEGLPAGIKYTVVEKFEPESDRDSYEVSMTGDIGEMIEKDVPKTVTFTNTLLGSLTVSKTVTGTAGETDKYFKFTVTLSDTSINGPYGDMEFENGVATFTLKHDESKTATGLSGGITYTVEETEANADGYETIYSGDTGKILPGKTATAEFFNHKDMIIQEQQETGSLTVSKTVTGTAGETDKYFKFTVTLNKAINGTYGDMEFTGGEATITLKHDESKTATGLPAGSFYTVIESDNEGYEVSATGNSGTIPENGTAIAAFTNHKDAPAPGNLTVSKTVTGNAGDKSKAFTFTVTLGYVINGTYGDMEFVDGVATFTLKHGESKTATGLPAEIAYMVAESDNAGYTVVKSGYEGTIRGGITAEAKFTNTRNVTPTSSTTSNLNTPPPPAPSETPEISVVRDKVPQTGDNSHMGLWLAMLALSLVVMGMGFCTLRRKISLHEEEKHLK